MIKLENVSKSFSKKEIIHSIDLTIDKPLIYGLLGPNGAGKTTTIRMICGIIEINSGNIYRDKKFDMKSVGYMPEEIGLYKDMSIIDEIIYFGKLHNVSKEKVMSAALPLINKFKLSNDLHKPVAALSKGTSRKVQFICTLIHSPRFLILDEPFSGLDPLSSEIMEKELLKLKDEGKTIVLSTHRMEHAEVFCDHIFILDNGEIIINDTLQSIKLKYLKNSYEIHVVNEINLNPKVEYSKIEMDKYYKYTVRLNENFTYEQLISALSGNQILLFKQEAPTLKEIFLKNTNII
jgi:ABC-2 type transport system ATP-binding protein